MPDYDIKEEDIPMLAENTHNTMEVLFNLDSYSLSLEETIEIMKNAYK